MNTDLGLLEWLGGMLDCPVIWDGEPETGGERQLTVQDELIQGLLRIRTKTGKMHFKMNRSQVEYSRRCTKRNIVLKARQVGITTYIAARFFIRTITRRGTLSVQVAHDRESAEEIFRIVKRFWDRLPLSIREGPLRTSYCNARQLVFPGLDSEYCVTAADDNAGRGWTIQNLHCSEVARWGPRRRGSTGIATSGGGTRRRDRAGREVQGGPFKGDRRHGGVPQRVQLVANQQAVGRNLYKRGKRMSFSLKKKAVLVVLIALSATAFAKPAHLLLHVAKSILYPVRYPKKSSHGAWKLIREVF